MFTLSRRKCFNAQIQEYPLLVGSESCNKCRFNIFQKTFIIIFQRLNLQKFQLKTSFVYSHHPQPFQIPFHDGLPHVLLLKGRSRIYNYSRSTFSLFSNSTIKCISLHQVFPNLTSRISTSSTTFISLKWIQFGSTYAVHYFSGTAM